MNTRKRPRQMHVANSRLQRSLSPGVRIVGSFIDNLLLLIYVDVVSVFNSHLFITRTLGRQTADSIVRFSCCTASSHKYVDVYLTGHNKKKRSSLRNAVIVLHWSLGY